MSYSHLAMDERNVIYRMQFQGYSDAEIKVLWDRDAKDGNKPVDWSKGKYFKPYNSIPFANGVARAQQEIANRMQASGVRVENVHTAYAHGPIEIRFEADSKYYGTTDKWATKLGPFGSEDEARKALGLGMQRETMRRV